jgi:hypothetical protein
MGNIVGCIDCDDCTENNNVYTCNVCKRPLKDCIVTKNIGYKTKLKTIDENSEDSLILSEDSLILSEDSEDSLIGLDYQHNILLPPYFPHRFFF